jgi:hypothetical protein
LVNNIVLLLPHSACIGWGSPRIHGTLTTARPLPPRTVGPFDL